MLFFLSSFVFIQSRPIFLVYFVGVASLIFLNLVLLHQQIVNSSCLHTLKRVEKPSAELQFFHFILEFLLKRAFASSEVLHYFV